MDNILDKFGLYDFFGLLIPGMYFLLVLDLLGIPQLIDIQYPTNEAIMVVMFVVLSYVIGTTMQEIASFMDRKYMHLRRKAMTTYLDEHDEESCLTKKELEDVEKLVGIKSNDSAEEKQEKCKAAFFEYKTHLEINDKMAKANKLDAMFAMSRDLIICNAAIFGATLIAQIIGICRGKIQLRYFVIFIAIHLAISIILSILLWMRAQRYANMRVRAIIRQYIRWIKEDTSTENTQKEDTSKL